MVFDTTRELFWCGAIFLAKEYIGAGLSEGDLRVLAAAAEMDDGEERPDDAVALARDLWERHVGNTFSARRADADRLKAQALAGTATALSPDTMVAVRELLKEGGDITPAGVHVAKTALETLVIMAIPERRLRNTWDTLGSDDLLGFAELSADAACADAMARDDAPADLPPDITGAERIAAVQERWARRWLDLDAGEKAHFRSRYLAHTGAFLSLVDRGFTTDHPNPSEAAELLPSAELPGGRHALWLDSALMVYLRRMVGPGKGKAAELVDALEAEAAQRWADWTGEPRQTELTPASLAERANTLLKLWNVTSEAPIWMRVIARVVWLVEVREALHKRSGKVAPSLLSMVVRATVELWTNEPTPPAARLRRDGEMILYGGDQRPAHAIVGRFRAPVVADGTLEATWAGVDALGVLGDPLIRYLARQAWSQYKSFHPDFRAVEFPHGLTGACKAIGVDHRRSDELREALRAGQLYGATTPAGDIGGLWTWTDTPKLKATRDRTAVLRVVVGDPLLPGFTEQVPEGGDHRRLLPVLERPFTGFQGANRSRVAVYFRAQWRVLGVLRDDAPRSPPGVLLLSDARWNEAMDLAEVTKRERVGMRAAWIGAAPTAWLREVSPGLVRLTDDDAQALLNGARELAKARKRSR